MIAVKTSKREVAQLIRAVLDGSIGKWDWDDLTSIRQADPEMEAIRLRLIRIYDEYPAGKSGGYCNEAGAAELIRIADALDPPKSQSE